VKKPFTIATQVTVEIKTQQGQKVNVTVQVDGNGQNAIVIDSRPATAVQVITTTVQGTVTPTVVEVEISGVTGLETNFTTGGNILTEILVKPQVITTEECQPIALEQTEYTNNV
jgi:hypothetical protein